MAFNPLLPIDVEARDLGVDRVYRSSISFLSKYGLRLEFESGKREVREAIGEVWDGLGTLDYRSLLTGNTQTALSDLYMSLTVYAVAHAQFKQYELSLPRPNRLGIVTNKVQDG